MSLNKVVLLLGSNINDPENNIYNAINLLNDRFGTILVTSELVKTAPVEFVSENFFCNIALIISTDFSPIQLLKVIKEIERQMGRLYDSSYFGEYRDRIIDIDIIKFNNIIFESKKLLVPHKKHLYERDFAKEILKTII